MFYLVIPIALLFKAVSCGVIWGISRKHMGKGEYAEEGSEIIVPPDDEISSFRFVCRILGVVCAYHWNAMTFFKTFATEVGIIFCLFLISCVSSYGQWEVKNRVTKLDILEEKLLLGSPGFYSFIFIGCLQVSTAVSISWLGLIYQSLVIFCIMSYGFAENWSLHRRTVDFTAGISLLGSSIQMFMTYFMEMHLFKPNSDFTSFLSHFGFESTRSDVRMFS